MSPTLLPLLAAPFVGSTLGVWVRRIPRGEGVVRGRSHCEACGATLRVQDLVPVASFLALRGRCRDCGSPIAPAHLWIELAAVAVVLSASAAEPDAASLWADCVLGWGLLALGWIDWTHLRLPDVLTLPLLLLGLGAAALDDLDAAVDHAWAAALGYAALWLLAAGYRRLRGRDGLGGGDAKLLAASGAWVGLAGLGPVLLCASAAGLAVALIRGGKLRAATVLPFGTCLAAGTWVIRLLLT